jgi:Flp pilus assembly protein TadG
VQTTVEEWAMRRWRSGGIGFWGSPQGERGAVLAEFVLVAPVLLVLVFGIIQFGFAFSRAQSLEAAAHEGARLASLSTMSSSDVVGRVTDTLAGGALGATPAVAVLPATCAGRQGETVTVTVSVPHRITIPLALDREITLTRRAVFRCEA